MGSERVEDDQGFNRWSRIKRVVKKCPVRLKVQIERRSCVSRTKTGRLFMYVLVAHSTSKASSTLKQAMQIMAMASIHQSDP